MNHFARNGRGETLAARAGRSLHARLVRDRRAVPAPGFAENHPKTLGWRVAQLLIAGSRDHAFLDRPWLPWVLRLTPPGLRKALSLRLLSLSPHYWVYQWTNYYPAGLTRGEILAREFRRNADSRRQLCDGVLARFLRPGQEVLDFGCGPGFLAKEVSSRVARVVAADVSRGVLACARHLNGADNLAYVKNGRQDLAGVPDRSVDLVYSFAVFQHLLKEQAGEFFREFARVLKPGGTGVCHTILEEPGGPNQPGGGAGGWVSRRVDLRMVYYRPEELRSLLGRAGFRDVVFARVSELTSMRDDIGREHLVTFRR